jgi:hypothetical protein
MKEGEREQEKRSSSRLGKGPDFVGTMLFKNYIDASQETMTNGPHDHTVMFVLAAFAQIEGFEIRVMLSSDRSGEPQSAAQVDGTALAQVGVGALELWTEGSRPAKATSCLRASKRWMSPISPKMVAAKVVLMPGMVVRKVPVRSSRRASS